MLSFMKFNTLTIQTNEADQPQKLIAIKHSPRNSARGTETINKRNKEIPF
jgi:hypothetical protein